MTRAQILLADILPTGLYCAKTAWNMLSQAEKAHPTTAVVIGCGPVGLCVRPLLSLPLVISPTDERQAITAAAEMFTTVIAVDSIPDRLESAKLHGATEVVKLVLPPRPPPPSSTGAQPEAKAAGAGAAVVGESGEKGKVDGSTAPPPTGAEAVVSRISELTSVPPRLISIEVLM